MVADTVHGVCTACAVPHAFVVDYLTWRNGIARTECKNCGESMVIHGPTLPRFRPAQDTPEQRAADRAANQDDLRSLRQERDTLRYGAWR